MCSYDRAGFGWSDPRPGPRDANRIADQLHILLNHAGITGPIILMGHSIAGLYIRAYATRYPQNLSGLVFVDGSTPLQDDRFPDADTGNLKFELLEEEWLYILGIPRIRGDCKIQGFEDTAGRKLSEDQCRPSLFPAVGREEESIRQSGNETIHSGPFGDLPILIFSQDTQSDSSNEPPSKEDEIWNQMQEESTCLQQPTQEIHR